MSGVKKALPFVILLGIGAMAGGGIYVYKNTEKKQLARREQAYADLSQCLFGERVEAPDTAATSITSMQARGAHLPDSTRWVEGGMPWPQRCKDNADELMSALRDASMMKEDPKRNLMKELAPLVDDLKKPDAQTSYLVRSVVGFWRSAEQNGLLMAAESKVAGPEKTGRIDADLPSLALPFASILPVGNGPTWHFLGTRNDKKDALASCSANEDGLQCLEFTSDDSFFPNGTWESAAFLPEDVSGGIALLRDGKLEKTKITVPKSVHVDAAGTVFAVNSPFVDDALRPQLVIQPLGKEPTTIQLQKLLEKRVPEGFDMQSTFVLGGSLVAPLEDKSLAFPLTAEGKLGEPIAIALDDHPCRAGAQYVLTDDKKLQFFDGAKTTEVTIPSKDSSFRARAACSPSGAVQIGGRVLCRSSGCVEVIDETGYKLFEENVQHPPVMDVIGDRIVYTWGAKDGAGLLVHVGDKGMVPNGKDILVVEKTGGKGPSKMGVFGGPKGAIAVADVEGTLIGFRITENGEVGPLKVTWK
ncbi:MAG: hypothetical protein HOW73_25625 [Polyangiaceae bacterium]|nr:hypothetical protein [Polyangiaceae bacterium]